MTHSTLTLPNEVVKRDGSRVGFDSARIEKAVRACYGSLASAPETPAEVIIEAIHRAISARFTDDSITVEQIQDLAEVTLLAHAELDAARHYISYRDEHAKMRAGSVDPETRDIFEAEKKFFPTPLRQFQFYDKYSRFNWDLMRRETWPETVDRNVEYLRTLVREHGATLPGAVWERIHRFILEHKAMPSMRSLSQAGAPALRNSLAIYNCSYMPVQDIDVFAEAMMVSMAGCGVGFSVERQYVEQFPRIKRQTGEVLHHTVLDTSEGWAESLRFGLQQWFNGRDVKFDYTAIREKGAVLKTKGGRASGPAPLKFVHDFCRAIVLKRQGSFLRTLDAHDMMCATGGAAVSGGVRRTAMISLFSWDDEDMRTCKDGAKLDNNPVRWNANNSAVWPEGLTQLEVIQQMLTMAESGRGEPGIFSRVNAQRNKPERREVADFGTNPCGEINLRPFGLCNLSIAVARPDDTLDTLAEKVEVASIIGTIQSLATNFPGMRKEWEVNCRQERLLGVDVIGHWDSPAARDAEIQAFLKEVAVETNEKYAEELGIAPAAAVTCNKPSGNSSVLLDASSGIHPRWAPYYLRRTRVSASTPLYRVLKDAGVPMRPENGQVEETATTWVVAWPVKSPEGAPTRKDRTALEQCEYWLQVKLNWAEHNPSVTITYEPDEVLDIIAWVWKHRDVIGGMTFLPADDAKFDQMPYEEISAEEYERASAEFPDIDFSLLSIYEEHDMTTAAQEVACSSGACDA